VPSSRILEIATIFKVIKMKTNRRIIQFFIYISFLVFFFLTVYPYNSPLQNPFTRISPLAGISLALMGKITILFFIGILLLFFTFFLGRFFCGWMCPLGTTFDIVSLCPGMSKKQQKIDKFNPTWIKYSILTIILTATPLHFYLGHYFDPVTIIYRFYTFVIFPPVNALWVFIGHHFPMVSEISLTYGNTNFIGAYILLIFIGALIILNRFRKRSFCRYICPMGAILALFSRFSILNKKVSDSCINCDKCSLTCKMGAIPQDPKEFKKTECIYCFSCVKECPVKAISFQIDKNIPFKQIREEISNFFILQPSSQPESPPNFSRRTFLLSILTGIFLSAIWKLFKKTKKSTPSNIIRPPASLPEDEFNSTCIRCGECMKVCITGGLQPTLMQAGIASFMTPRLVPRIGHCEVSCNLCQKVCPTHAIRSFKIEDKLNISIGKAVIDETRCIAWAKNANCLICDEHCPVKAIYLDVSVDVAKPIVDKKTCIGCGLCENKCPVAGEAAIRVFGYNS
jgi:MauM/NapG family ferredoxin protein